MFFEVLPLNTSAPHGAKSQAYLLSDNWNDWYKFRTQYYLIYYDDDGEEHGIGDVKIGQFHMEENQDRPNIPQSFDQLGEDFFSLGQDDSYYERIKNFGTRFRRNVLRGLRDIAFDLELFDNALKEEVTTESLLRNVREDTVRGQFHRMAYGGARLTNYYFSYELPVNTPDDAPTQINFEVEPESNPPSNVHVLIGRNGVGKTYILSHMAKSLVNHELNTSNEGHFTVSTAGRGPSGFSSLIYVSFSAFDEYEDIVPTEHTKEGIEYYYVGLKGKTKEGLIGNEPMAPQTLAEDFAKSASECLSGATSKRWLRALNSLESDPIFETANVASLIKESAKSVKVPAMDIFSRLSSGHKIVLLAITKIVEVVRERSLVLMDEPEAHLHPPLLSAYVRAISELVIDRNGVAILATHSPVVLQEVPSNCVWKLRRSGREVVADRPNIQTFGENVGTLTRESFGLEVTRSGFHNILKDSIDKWGEFDRIYVRFGGRIGAEGQSILRSLIAIREKDD